MARRRELRRVTAIGALLGLVSMLSGFAMIVFGGGLASASTASLDCSTPYGGDYLATVSGDTATVTLNPDCTASPYYLLVYSASNNDVQAVNPLPASCPTYPLTTTAGTIDPTDPNSYCSFPSNDVFPEYAAAGSPVEFSGSPDLPGLTASVTLPNSCWELDVENDFGAQVSPVTNVAEGLGGNFIWGENGPVGVSCSPVSTTTTTTAPTTTTTTAPTTTTTTAPTTTTTTAPTTTTTTAPTTTTTTAPTTTTTTAPTTTTTQSVCVINCGGVPETTTTTHPTTTSTTVPTTTTSTTHPTTTSTTVPTTTTSTTHPTTTSTTVPTTTTSTTHPTTTTTVRPVTKARKGTTTTVPKTTTTTVPTTTTSRPKTTTTVPTTVQPHIKAKHSTTTVVTSTVPTTVPPTPTTVQKTLAYTGADAGGMLDLAIALLLGGATLIGLSLWKRRQLA